MPAFIRMSTYVYASASTCIHICVCTRRCASTCGHPRVESTCGSPCMCMSACMCKHACALIRLHSCRWTYAIRRMRFACVGTQVHARTYNHPFAHIHVYTWTWYACLCTHAFIPTLLYPRVYKHAFVRCMFICMHVYVCMCVHASVCRYI